LFVRNPMLIKQFETFSSQPRLNILGDFVPCVKS